MRNRFFGLAMAALLPFLMAGPAGALEAVDAYARRSVPGDVVRPLGEDLFGDRVNFYNGVTTFAVTDVSLPGNSTLPVAIRRTHTAGAKGGRFGDMFEGPPAPGLFGEWDLD